ncbi:MAG TPA: XdhC family protein [Pyrinomonadaceae bacterium]|jgi:xanthine dehydrogenase accessory factor|nr:XdhC family protein [Pyrinomonadaceae bacterium]
MKAEGEQTNNPESITGAVARVLEEGAVAALVTLVEARAASVGAKMLVGETGARLAGGTGDAAFDERLSRHALLFLKSRAEARTYSFAEIAASGITTADEETLAGWRETRVLYERIEPEAHVVVCGAGHVGASLARLAHAVGYRVTLIDDRADFVRRALFPEADIELVSADDWTEPVRAAVGRGRGVSVAVVTRGHNEDEECLRAVLAARPDYVGMIGSRRRTNIVLERLRESGVDEALLREVRAPVGLDVGAVSPQEVALSILAEIVAERRGGTGGPLSAWRRK